MALWDKISFGFDAEDETVNFGKRSVVEQATSIYESSTLATIQPNQPVNESKVVVKSCVQRSMLCLAIDRTITIFHDDSCTSVLLNATFDETIQCYSMSNDGKFLFIVLSSGLLTCVELSSTQLVFNEPLVFDNGTKPAQVVKISLKQVNENELDLYFVDTEGIIHCLSGFCEEEAALAASNGNEECLRNIFKSMAYFKVSSGGFRGSNICYAASALKLTNEEAKIVTIGSCSLYSWPSERKVSLFNDESIKYRKVQLIKNDVTMIILCSDGSLRLMCSETLLEMTRWEGPVEDFIIVQDQENNDLQIAVLTKPHDDSNSRTLQYLSYPDFNIQFQMNVSLTTKLVELIECSTEHMIYLESILDANGMVESIRVKAIIENSPGLRYDRLLRKQQYDEALIFAKRFNLDYELLYRSKAASLTTRLGPYANDETRITIDQFIELLDKMSNVKDVHNYCNNVLLANHKEIHRLLLYAYERVAAEIQNSQDNKELLKLLTTVNGTLCRLTTFEAIESLSSCNRANEASEEQLMNKWIDFSKANLLKLCENYLMHGELKIASLIWAKHFPEMSNDITLKVVQDLLEASPKNDISLLLSWLGTFVPTILQYFPDALPNLLSWSYKTIISLEKTNQQSSWPDVALDFAKKLIVLLNVDDSSMCSGPNEQYNITNNSPFQRFISLTQALDDLKRLKQEHRIIVPINVYTGDPKEVLYLLLNKINVNELHTFIEGFFKQYCRNYSLKSDAIFVMFIKRLLQNSKFQSWFWNESSWEKKIIMIIELINSVEDRLLQTLSLLKKAPVPWSASIASLVDKSLKLKHPLVAELRMEHNLMPTKLIIKKYGQEVVDVNDLFLSYVIKQNRAEVIEDILELTKTNPRLKRKALNQCVYKYLNKGDIERSIDVIRKLSEKEQLCCCECLITHVSNGLQMHEMCKEDAYFVEAFGAIEHIFEAIAEKSPNLINLPHTLERMSEIKIMYQMRKDFNIVMSPAELTSAKIKAIQNYINNLHIKDEASLENSCRDVKKICHLLRCSNLQVANLLFEKIPSSTVLNCFQLQYEVISSSDDISHLYKLNSNVLKNAKDHPELPQLLRNINTSILFNSSNYEKKIMETSTWTNLHATIIEKKIPDEWKLYSYYSDVAISSGHSLISLLLDLYKIHNICVLESMEIVEERNQNIPEARDIDVLMRNLSQKIKYMQVEQCDYGIVEVLCAFYYQPSSFGMREDTLKTFESILTKCICSLFNKIIGTSISFDSQLGLACLFMLSEAQATKLINHYSASFDSDYLRLKKVNLLAYNYYDLIGDVIKAEHFAAQLNLHVWAKKLSQFDVSYKEIFSEDHDSKRKILKRLTMSKKEGVLEILEEFCVNFNFKLEEVLLLYLKSLLKNWEPDFVVKSISTKEEVEIKSNEVEKLEKQCKIIAAKIDNVELLAKEFRELLKEVQINFYHYEIFIIVHELINDVKVNTMNYLLFLQHYTRVGAPTSNEVEIWSRFSQENTALPKIAKYRLPYLPQVDLLKIITPELNLDTYEYWLDIGPVLNIAPAVICTLAVKGAVKKAWEHHNPSNWVIEQQNPSLLQNIKHCLSKIEDVDLLHTTAAMYYVVNHTPPGGDQVAAAKECFGYAQKLTAQPSHDDGTIEKVKDKYLKCISKHLLHKEGMGKPCYISLISQPEKLIRELYQDESIPLRYRGLSKSRPNISYVVQCFAKQYGLNLFKLKKEFLEDWLQQSGRNEADMNDSFTVSNLRQMASNESASVLDDDLLRAIYILDDEELELKVNYLINIAFNNDVDRNYRAGMRYRACKVLMSLGSETFAPNLRNLEVHDIKKYTRSMWYLSKLEALGYEYSIDSFDECNKPELVQILWQNHSYSPQALDLIRQLCLDYQIFNTRFWNSILTQMTKLNMNQELMKTLIAIRGVNGLQHCEGYINGWQTLISEPFMKLEYSQSQEQIEECVKAVQFLNNCTLVKKLKLKKIIDHCLHLRLHHLAALFLLFLGHYNHDCDREYVLNEMQQRSNLNDIIEELKELWKKGISSSYYAIELLEKITPRKNGVQ